MNTFEITIQRAQGVGWPVVVRHQPGPTALTNWAQGIFDLNPKQLDLIWPADRQYGTLLGQNVFRDQVRDAFVRALSGAKAASEPLRVFLIVEAEDLRSRHWEQLCAPFEGGRWDHLLLNQQTPFSLYLPSQIERRFPPIGRRDLRALLLVAGPEELEGDYGLEPFDVSATVAALTASLGEIPYDVLANSDEGIAGEPSLNALCDQFTARHYTLLFIVSHGAYLQEDGETILYFPEDKNRKPVTGSKLIERMGRLEDAQGLPHFTFLSTCESADPQAENGLGGLGQRLVRQLGMPAVLAMTDRVSIQTAQALSEALCTRLAEHGEVDRALAEALAGLQGRYDVTVPALFSRLGGRPLFSDALGRPLTAAEIRYGLEQLGDLLEERAPVLVDEFQPYATKIRATLDTDPDTLAQEARREQEAALTEVNQLSTQALDISFNALALGHKPPEYDPRSPFRGLYPFRAEDREFFFGRQALVDELTRRLNKHNFLAVLGPSGCGKSSLVLAGLMPALDVPMAYITPGSDPLAQLESTLEEAHPESILVVDQFEELFTLCSDEDQRQDFLDRLLRTSEKMRVVITMRADFLGDCAAYPGLRSAMEAHQALIGPMSAAELRRAMERQADHVGLRFEAGLGEQILDDVQGEPGAMPLLQHALLLLWQRRHGRWLRWQEYTAIGGIREAIAHTAEEVFAGLSDGEKVRVRNIFIRLTRLPEMGRSPEDARYTRRRVKLGELVPAGSDEVSTTVLVNRLADARLVVTRQHEATAEVEVDVAHEALIQHWPRLRTWLDENRADILLREALTQAAREWESLDRDPGALYRGARLAQASEWADEHPNRLNILEQGFLTASQDLAQREQAAREAQRQRELALAHEKAEAERLRAEEQARGRSRLQKLVIGLAIIFIIAVAAAIFALIQRDAAVASATEALHAEETAETRRLEALRAQETAEARRIEAELQTRLARSRQLAAQSMAILDNRLDLALLLSLQGYLISQTDEALSAMLAALNYSKQPYRLIYGEPHETPQSMAISPDGTMTAVGYDDGAVIVFNLENGKRLQTLNIDYGMVWALLFLPDNRLLVGVTGGRVYLWERGEDMPQRSVDVLEPVVALTFNQTEERVFSIDRYGNVLSWNMLDQIGLRVTNLSSLVTRAAFSRDGRYLALERDGAIIIYSMMEGEEIFEQAAGVVEVAINPDGSQIAAIGSGNNIYVWDIHTREKWTLSSNAEIRLEIGRADTDALHLIYSPDGEFLAMTSGSLVHVWDTATAKLVSPALRAGPSASIGAIAFSPDSRALLSAVSDGNVIRWELPVAPDGLVLATAVGSSLATLSPDGTMAAFSYDDLGQVRLWDMTTDKPADGHLGSTQDRVIDAAFSPDGEALALISHPDGIRAWDLVTAEPVGPLLPGRNSGHLMFDSVGSALVLNYDNNSVGALNAYTGARVKIPSLPATFDSISPVSESNPGIAIASSISETLVVDILTGDAIGGIEEGLDPFDATAYAVTETGGLIAGITQRTLVVWDVASGSRILERSWDELNERFSISFHGSMVEAMAFSSDAKYLVTQSRMISGLEWIIIVWDVEEGNVEKTLTVDEFDWQLQGFNLGPKDNKLIGFGRDGSLQIWSFPELTPLWNQSGIHNTWFRILRFSNDGHQFVTVDEAGNAGLWDSETGARLPQLWSVHLAEVVDLSFDINGRRLASAGADNTVAIWSTSTGELEIGPHQLILPIAMVAFDDTGNQLAIGGSDGSLAVWHLNTDEVLEAHQLLDSSITAIKFHPTEPWLAVAGSDKMVHIFNINNWTQRALFSVDELANELAWTEDGITLLNVGDHMLVYFDTRDAELRSDISGIQNELDSVKIATLSPDTQMPVIFERESLVIWSVEDDHPYGPAIQLESDTLLDAKMLSDGRILAIIQNNKTRETSIVTLTFVDWYTAICYTANRKFTLSEREIYQLNTLPENVKLACD